MIKMTHAEYMDLCKYPDALEQKFLDAGIDPGRRIMSWTPTHFIIRGY